MGKKILSLLLVFALVLGLCPAALAAEDDVRETNFFTDQPHAAVNYADMEYRHLEAEPFNEAMDAIRALMDSADNVEKVEELFDGLAGSVMELLTMYSLIDIRTYHDVYDEWAAEEQEYTYALYIEVVDALEVLIRDILKSPCAAFMEEQLSEEEIEYYLAYEEMTEEEKALAAKETALENEYMTLAASITVEYNGEEWTADDAYYAYMDDEISYADYEAISQAYTVKQNEVLGEIYLRMVEVRKEIAKAAGYDTYTDYAYTEVYDRDYTKEEIRAFHQAVKDCGYYDLYEDFLTLIRSELDYDVYLGDYAGDVALNMIEPYLGKMSSELAEAFAYMRQYGLYDSGYGENKSAGGFTTILNSYGAPFFFNSPSEWINDFTTAVHEFGHYNNYYWEPNGWNDESKNIDLAEVHSQGMELVFSHWYPEIFGASAQFVLDFQIWAMVGVICDGALYDELQQFVYETDDVTLEQINQKYLQLAVEYGMAAEDDPLAEYEWVGIHHTFTSPCYYISYAVSAAGALSFWLDMQEKEYFDVLDEYLKFVALPANLSFQESFTELGMENPTTPAFLEELAEALRTAAGVDERLGALEKELSFSDVTEADWFYEYVMFLTAFGPQTGLDISGYEDGTFRPQENAVVGLLDAEAENAEAPILRGDFCRILTSGILGVSAEDLDGIPSPFSDTDDPAVAAVAVLGIINGYGDGTFRPDQPMTRAEFCAAFCRTLQMILVGGGASVDEAA